MWTKYNEREVLAAIKGSIPLDATKKGPQKLLSQTAADEAAILASIKGSVPLATNGKAGAKKYTPQQLHSQKLNDAMLLPPDKTVAEKIASGVKQAKKFRGRTGL